MKLGVFTLLYTGQRLEQMLDKLAALGVETVELSCGKGVVDATAGSVEA
jgi:sugar phosphate isomerase/epimerase